MIKNVKNIDDAHVIEAECDDVRIIERQKKLIFLERYPNNM